MFIRLCVCLLACLWVCVFACLWVYVLVCLRVFEFVGCGFWGLCVSLGLGGRVFACRSCISTYLRVFVCICV